MKLSFFLSTHPANNDAKRSSEPSVFTNQLSWFAGWSQTCDSTSTTFPIDESSASSDNEYGDDEDNEFEDSDSQRCTLEKEFEQQDVSQQYFSLLNDRFQTYITKKQVAFCLEANVYYETELRSEEENDRSWYDQDSLNAFKEIAAIEARTVFPRKRGTNATRTILAAFHTYSKAKSDEARDQYAELIDRDALNDLYSSNNRYCIGNCLGLESHALRLVRGEPKGLVRFIMDQSKSWAERRGASKNNTSRRHYAEWRVIDHVSECISRPSRFLAHELALAHAASLDQPHESCL